MIRFEKVKKVYKIKSKKILWCIFFVEFGETAMIWRLCVRKKYRNQWFGSKLLQKTEKLIKKRWLKQISWFVDTEKNDLHKRYKKLWYKKELSYYFIYKDF